jgi:hypothetical protein
MPVPIDPLGALPLPVPLPLVLPLFFFNVAVLGICPFVGMPAVEGAELKVCEGEEKWMEEFEPSSPELSCRRAFSWRA